ncbi:response regulator [Metapseudomonas resinovorans]|uniref:histidine kinase n=1 Tax=Metapseudomonas resinovorans NBRC 106553 TaxID=1245471 RepID=S6AG12_METRE|nr:response regulator [Pseudomonas resinovorans]BAN49067.1 two-component hybrid sensor and regulator SagS [Pseudomonas resinovorans NBRC 106553]
MDIPLTKRLSFKQASLTVLVAFILGTILSVIQVASDYFNENASIDREIKALLEISHSPAARIAYNIDAELAQELVLGLLRSPAVIRAEIIDNNGAVLSSVSRPRTESDFRIFSDYLFGERREFEDPLYIVHAPNETLGVLRLEVDTFAFGNHFLRRAMFTLLSGFVRSLLLSLILLVLFYSMLTKPLVELIRALSERDPRAAPEAKLPCPPGHEQDEIGVLVEVINRQLASLSAEMQQRREADQRLNQYLAELENIVSARTAELKAANSRLSRYNQELEAARGTALEMAKARAAFLANMSHEIRTPLNGLLGMLDLAIDGPLNNEQRRQLQIAHNSGSVLVELLNDILDLSKFEAGQLELEQIPFDLGTLLEDTANLLSQNAGAEVELTCLIDPQLPALLVGDPTRVRQVASNLLSNALKFTRSGRVDLRAAPSPGGVLISVRDTGIGISAQALPKLFQPFSQGNAGITRQFGGTGLGLALTRHLCEAMQGQLDVKSQEGMGSVFSAELPLVEHTSAERRAPLRGKVIALCDAKSGLAEMLGTWLPLWGLELQRHDGDFDLSGVQADLLISDDPERLEPLRRTGQLPILLVTGYDSFLPPPRAATLTPLHQLARPVSRAALYQALQRVLLQLPEEAPAPETAMAEPQHRHARVLLVEDNAVNQLVAKGMLAKLGCEVLLAGHGAEALSRLEQSTVDLVLMDCNMPVMDGYEATRRIRQSGRWPDLPIIALTANALPDERERCRAAGMDDYLAKPFRREELVALLDTWLPATQAVP